MTFFRQQTHRTSACTLRLPLGALAMVAAPLLGSLSVSTDSAELAMLPSPRSLERLDVESYRVAPRPTIAIGEEALRPHANAFAENWWRLTGVRPTILPGERGDFVLSLTPDALEAEQYRVEIDGAARVCGGSITGVAHGTATLLQLAIRDDTRWTLPGIAIDDQPDAPFRAVMVDIARRPHGVATLRSLVELLYLYKVRYLHLHLTDDQAFRFPFPPVTDALPKNQTISLPAWKELVAYADARGVTILPELELPGHSKQLKLSGYLDDPTPDDRMTDADVAHPVNHDRIFRLIDAMREVFASSPYFHVGGDESGAGRTLVPFLAAVNRHLCSEADPARRSRLLVWEGFHGSPEELPATGEDRIVVVSWESSYNPPWKLLDAGYEVINASWKPLYVVGGGAFRYPHIGGRKWSPRDLHAWSKNQFWHWQPGTPVFEDRGPQDDHPDDGIWRVPDSQQEQVLGGQLLFWEQAEHTVLRDSWERVPALSDRLWSGGQPSGRDFVGFRRRHDAVAQRVRRLVQPVRAVVAGDVDLTHPTADDFLWIHEPVRLELDAPGELRGEIRVARDGSDPTAGSELYERALEVSNTGELRAQLFVEGLPVGSPTRAAFDRRPARVRVAWFELPRRALRYVPDFSNRQRWTPMRSDLLPELRGPYRTIRPLGQQLDATLDVLPELAGPHVFRLKTRDGRARLLVDGKPLLGPSDPREIPLEATLELEAGPHAIQVHHASGNISPVVLVAVRRPGDPKFLDLSPLLTEIPRGTESGSLLPQDARIDLLADGLGAWSFVSREPASLEACTRLTEDGVLRLVGSPSGYLQTRRWYRDYELELEWRWPEGSEGGNSGVLVHATTPLLFHGWPRSLEVQLQAGRAGDFWTIGEDVDLLVEDASERRRPPRPGDLHSHRRINRHHDAREADAGGWNHLWIRCLGDEVIVRVNGVEANRGIDCSISQGALALQSEGTPIEFRRIWLQPIRRSLP